MADFELYVSKEKFTQELNQLDAKLNSLNQLLQRYQELKNRSTRVWGDQDENLAKAQQACQTAIEVVNKKIEETRQSKEALQNVLQSAETVQSQIGSRLDDAQNKIQSLL